MERRAAPKRSKQASSVVGSLTLVERGEVLGVLLSAHPELEGEAERVAGALLLSVSVEQIASEVESALVGIPVDALAARAGRVRGRGYVHETDAAWELLEEAIGPFRADLERRAALGVDEAATSVAVGIIAGLHRVREPEMGTVLAYAGDEAPPELAAGVLDLGARLGVVIPDDAPGKHWSSWTDRL